MSEPRKRISLIIPVYFEAPVLHAFHAEASRALAPLAPEFDLEFLYVNDGSTDQSLPILIELRDRDPRVKILSFSRNFGHQVAVTAGLDHAQGDLVVIIDADLQDPPEVILRMVDKWREGHQVVYGVRSKRLGESLFKRATAALFYRTLNALSDTPIPFDTGDFRLMDRRVVDAIGRMREENRFIRGMVSWVGFRQCPLEYTRDPRYAGHTKYTLRKMVRFAFNGITSFSERPLVLAGWLGLLVTACGFLFLLYILVGRFLRPESVVSGWTSLMGVILFFGGIQMLSLGILGQYIGRIYREVRRRPLYIIDAAWGLTPEAEDLPE